jgi:methylenetetrahydrofolate reductase (NADPH)
LKTFKDAIRNKEFAVSAEIYLRPETDAESLRIQADTLRDYVDGILLTDNQYGQLHLSTIAAAAILLGKGVDPIVQLASRNRNRLALLSDLLGAGALGVSSLVLVAGEKPPPNLLPKPKAVLDLSAIELIQTANIIKVDENLTVNPDFLLGGVVTPVMPKPNWQAKQFRDKVNAGAQFLMTHICMDVELLQRYLKGLIANQLIQRVSVVVSVAVLADAEDVAWLRQNRHNVMLPNGIEERLAGAADPRAEGIRICAETITAMREIPGVVGFNIMSSRDLTAIPDVIREAGLDG